MPCNRWTSRILTWGLLALSVVAGSLAAEFLGSWNEDARDSRRISQSPIRSPIPSPAESPNGEETQATNSTPRQSASSKHVAVGAE